ncbi:MAG: InlB B-repeat-containing protein [Clostridiales bacterium]|nr:InlB B-repeat-containing protein [Clostridiales bacterium]
MAISDEVIELAPVKKTKKTFIIMFVAMGILLALAATFLVMYLIKPSVEEDKSVVKGVTVSSTELFTVVENGKEVKYASIGHEYTIYANITVENGASPNIQWEVSPREALKEVDRNEGEGAYFKFIPNPGFHDQAVTIKARSQSKVDKYETVEFKVVNQGAEHIDIRYYYPQGETSNRVNVTGSTITLPHYSTVSNNKTFIMMFDQYGRLDPASPANNKVYAPISVIDVDGVMSNVVSVASSNSEVVDAYSATHNAFYFRAKKPGKATITITANTHNPDYDNYEKTIDVVVKSNEDLGFIEDIYFFNKAVVDADFINSILDTTRNSIDRDKLNKLIDADSTLEMNPQNITMPVVGNRVSYDNIFSHILIAPLGIQCEIGDKTVTMKSDWYKKIDVVPSNTAILDVNTDNTTGNVGLHSKALANSSDKNTKCTLTFTDKTAGSIKASRSVNVDIVAQTSGIEITATVGEGTSAKSYEDGEAIALGSNGTANLTVTYALKMPGNTDVDKLFDNGFVTTKYKLGFNPQELDVVAASASSVKLENGVVLDLKAMTFTRKGAETSSIVDFVGTTNFKVTVKAQQSGNYTLKYTKIGTSISGDESDDGIDSLNRTIEKTVTFTVTQKAKKAFFIGDEDAKALVTRNGALAGKFVNTSGERRDTANAYIQNQKSGTTFDSDKLFDIEDLVDTDVNRSECTVSWRAPEHDENVLSIGKNGTITFAGRASSDKALVLKIDVYDIEHNLIQTLTLDVYLIDAVDSFVEIDDMETVFNKNLTVDASKDIYPYIQFNRSLIKITRKLITVGENYRPANVKLYFGDEELTPNSVGNGIYSFSHEGQLLYEFDMSGTTCALTAKVDIYNYSLVHNADFGNVRLVFLLSDDEYYVGALPYGTLKCKFIRQADGVALFTDSRYSEAIGKNEEQSEFVGTIDQGAEVKIYVSSTVNVESSEQPIVVRTKGEIAPVENAFIVLKSEYNFPELSVSDAKDVEISDGTPYYRLSFKAPTVGDSGKELLTFAVRTSTRSVESSYRLTVLHQARAISAIELYGDSDYSTPLVSTDPFTFGEYISNKSDLDRFERNLYVKVKYVTYEPGLMYYESAILTLPSYLTASGDNITKDADSADKYILTPSGSADSVGEEGAKFVCKLTLAKDAAEHSSDTLAVAQANSVAGSDKIEVRQSVAVGAGLAGIKVTYDDGQEKTCTLTTAAATTINYTFTLKNLSDKKQLVLALAFDSLATDYPNLHFDNSAANFGVSYPSDVDGLTVLSSINARQSPSLTIAIADTVKLMNNYQFTVTFKDTSYKTTTNNEFTIVININVEVDIYALAFGDSGNEYKITTTGANEGEVGEKELPINVVYNEENYQPTAKLIADTNVLSIVRKTAESIYTEYNNGDIYIKKSGATYKLVIKNSVRGGEDYRNLYVKLSYGDLTAQYRQIVIETDSHRIEFAQDNDVELEQSAGVYTATVTVGEQNEFKIAAVVKNEGSGKIVDGKTISYLFFNDDTFTTEKGQSDGVTVSNSGVITINPTAATGVIYYGMRYTDVGGTGKTETIKVKLTYRVAVTGVKLSGLDSNTYNESSKKITLYVSYGKATTLDLTNYITAENEHAVSFGNLIEKTVTLKTSTDASKLGVSSLTLTPLAATGADGVAIIVTARYGSTEKSDTFYVVIVEIGALSFADGKNSGKINIVDNGTATVSPTYSEYVGLVATYTLEADKSGLTIVGDKDKTVSVTTRATTSVGVYVLTAKVTYTLALGSSLTLAESIVKTATFTLTVEVLYTPEFTFTCDGNEINEYDNTDTTKHAVKTDKPYQIVIGNATHGDSSASYRLTENGIIKSAVFSGDTATVTLNESASGEFKVKVIATVYGQEFSSEHTYYFMYGTDATAALSVSSDGSQYDNIEKNTQTYAIDFTETPKKFKYEISGIDTANVPKANVNIVVNGDVEVSEVQGGTGSYYVIITAKKPTTLFVGGSVKVGNITIYTEQFSLSLTATTPTFGLTVDNTTIATGGSKIGDAEANSAFNITQSEGGFINSYTVTYTAVRGGEYVDIAHTSGQTNAVVTAKNSITSDKTVIIRATVTVNNGVYNDDEYIFDKELTVKGYAVPTIDFHESSIELAVGGSKKFTSSDYAITDGYNAQVDVEFEVVSAGLTLASGTDYTFENNTLTILATDKTKAGGKITVKAVATVKSALHKDTTAEATIDVVITPQTKAVAGAYISNAVGTYDISSAITLYTATGTGFVTETDAKNITIESVELKDPSDKAIAEISGKYLTLTSNVTESGKTIALEVTVLIRSGAYQGKTIKGETSVAVRLPEVTAQSVAWSNGAYSQLSIGKDMFTIEELTDEITVTSIDVATVSESYADLIVVNNNNTATPKILVDKTANLSVGDDGLPRSDINLAYTVTLSNGHKYYGTSALTIEAVRVDVDVVVEGNTVTSGITRKSGDSFIASFATRVNSAEQASDTFAVKVNSVTITESGSAESDALSALQGDSNIMFIASDVSSEKTLNVTVSVSVGGQTASVVFTVTIKAVETSAAYAVEGATEFVDIAVGETKEVSSKWKANSTTQYKYGYSVTVTAPDTLSDYFESFALHTIESGNAIATATLGAASEDLYFETSNNRQHTHNSIVNEFYLKFKLNTESALERFDVIVDYRVYSGRQSYSGVQTVTVKYTFRVVGKVTVMLEANGGSLPEESDSIEVDYKGEYKGLPTPTRGGYEFDGWYLTAALAAEGKIIYVESGPDNTKVTKAYTHTVYAKWNARHYTIELNNNAGDESVEGGVKSISVTFGETYSGLPTSLTREGYTFDGWYTGMNDGVKVSNGDRLVSEPVPTVLYAHWTKLMYTVTIKADGGSFGGADTLEFTVEYGKVFNMAAIVIPTQENKKFEKWVFEVGGSGDVGSSFTVKGNTTIKAMWKDIEFTVTLDKNAGEDTVVGIPQLPLTVGATYSNLPTSLTREGYTFDGWYTGKNDGVKVNNGDKVVSESATITLYAHWTKQVYTVTIDANGGTIAGATTLQFKAEYGETFTAHENLIPTQENKKFEKWVFEVGGSGDVVSSFTVKGNTTIKATWKDIEYTVTLDKNAGEDIVNGIGESSLTVGATYSNLPTSLTRTGYTFVGWYTGESDGVEVNNGDKVVSESTTITLYARWTKNMYTITIKADGGTFGDTDTLVFTVEYGKTFNMSVIVVPTQDGQTFVKWVFDSETGGDVGASFTVEGDVTIKATWTEAD